MNKIILIGNLTRDVELNTTGSGTSYARFSIAVSRRFADADGNRETDFFNVVVWRGQAENCYKYLQREVRQRLSAVCRIGLMKIRTETSGR